jgi:DNA-binding NarL/FixJ family response regulator
MARPNTQCAVADEQARFLTGRSSLMASQPYLSSSSDPALEVRVRRISDAGDPTPHIGRTIFSDQTWERVTSVLALSVRESEILKAVFEDQKESCIAANLGISSHTVHTHLERIYRKLRVSSRVELVVRIFAEYLSKHLA